jgi:acetyl/propionyl-CoA carboxylase alpha subunit
VEVQILADGHGQVFALGERECSLQRRFQKIVEESPSVAVDAALRARMQEAACAIARAAGYVNAGTVEFLLGPAGQFYFLEMNTRLQVEHPVTEAVQGVDLVALQLAVARGERLTLAPREPRGHAMEVRLYAERPEEGFLPATGTLLHVRWPEGAGVRVDHAVGAGTVVSPHFDPMLAKVIAWGPDREHCRRRLRRALRETAILGVHTNLTWLLALLDTEAFARGQTFTHALPPVTLPEPPAALWAVAARAGGAAPAAIAGAGLAASSPFDELGDWRMGR